MSLGLDWRFPLVVLISTSFVGCLDVPESPDTHNEATPWEYTWSPPTGTSAFVGMVNITAGTNTKCTVGITSSGTFGSESPLSHAVFVQGDNGTGMATATRPWSTIHAGEMNSGEYDRPVWGLIGRSGYAGAKAEGGATLEVIFVAGDHQGNEDGTPYLQVNCDSTDHYTRIFFSDQAVPITDQGAKGGAGTTLRGPNPTVPGTVVLNVEDRFTVSTSGQETRFVAAILHADESTGQVWAEGELMIQSPNEQEVVPLEALEDQLFFLRRYQNPGDYEVGLQQIRFEAERAPHLVGILAGFNLESEHRGL